MVSLIPFMKELEENLKGIVTANGKVHKIKLFADDLKTFLSDLREI